jgi:tetratricopeptide (TPR) repeat protein
MIMRIREKILPYTIVCFLAFLCLLTVSVCAATIDDTFDLPQDLEEAMVKDAWEEGDLKRTQSMLNSALAKYPESAVLWDIQSGVALKRNDYRKAAEAETRALKISSTPVRHSNLGWIYFQLKQYNSAVMHYKIGLNGVQKCTDACFYLAECLEKIGRQDEAATYYRQYLEASPAGPKRNAAEERLASLTGIRGPGNDAGVPPAISGGLESLSPEQKRRSDADCNEKFPGLVAVDFNPQTRKVTCGCPDGGVDIGEGCLGRLELEIIRAVNRKDVDRAEHLAAMVKPGTQFYSKVLEDVRFLAKIKRETPWMFHEETFRREMDRRDREFQKAMREQDQQSRQNDALWAQLIQTNLETQMKAMSDMFAAAGSTAPSNAFTHGNTPPDGTPGGTSNEQMTDRLVLMQTPYDGPDSGSYNWVPPLNVGKDDIVGVWTCELFKIAVMKDGKNYVVKVLDTYPIPKKKGRGVTKYPFGPGETCCSVGEGVGGGGDAFLAYRGSGWLWAGTDRTWGAQELVMKSDKDGLYLYMYYGEADGHWFSAYKMRKLK